MQVDQKVDYIEFPAADFDAVQSFYRSTERSPTAKSMVASVVQTSTRRRKTVLLS